MHTHRRRFALASLAAIGTLSLSALASAQDYPGRTITIVVPFSAGGGVDTMARLLAEELRASLKQNVIVDNKPGASGMIGTTAVAKGTPDGYTLLMGSAGETAINAFVHKKQMQYSPAKDLAPIALVTKVPNVLVASKAFAPNTIEQLVDHARKNPGQVTYSSSGIGNPPAPQRRAAGRDGRHQDGPRPVQGRVGATRGRGGGHGAVHLRQLHLSLIHI